MKKLLYCYSETNMKIHTKFIKNKTILKEAKKAKKVDIYEINEIFLDNFYNGNISLNGTTYITTLLIREGENK